MYDAKQEFMDLCGKLADDITKPYRRPKTNIYIDADLLYHYRLGAVLALSKGEKEFNYVLEHIKDYIEAPTLECARFFPLLKLTDEQLDKIITDKKYFAFINAASPPSEFIDNIDKVIKIFNTYNESKDDGGPITITINQRTIDIHPVYKVGLFNRLKAIDPNVKLTFTNYGSWYDVPEPLIEKQDFICVYDMVEFLREGTNSQKVLSSVPPKLMHCSIVTPMQHDGHLAEPSEETYRNLKAMLEIMCDQFSFINKTIITEELFNG